MVSVVSSLFLPITLTFSCTLQVAPDGFKKFAYAKEASGTVVYSEVPKFAHESSYTQILESAIDDCKTDTNCLAFEIMRNFSTEKNPEFRSWGQIWANKIDASPEGWMTYKLQKKASESNFDLQVSTEVDFYATDRDAEIYHFKAGPTVYA